MIAPGRRLFLGTVGSTAYGLAREGSDRDHLGIFVTPTEALWSFDWNSHKETWTNSGPGNDNDTTMHEIGKYCRLALAGNPTILELMWLPPDLWETDSEEYRQLRSIRRCFLNERSVRAAYGGYARQQVERLVRRNAEGKEGFSSDTQGRTAKHARHTFRLLEQGYQLLTTGEMSIRVSSPEEYWALDDATVEDIVDRFEVADHIFRTARSILPTTSDVDTVQAYLNSVRRKHL